MAPSRDAEAGPLTDVWELMVAGSVAPWTALASVGAPPVESLPALDARGLLAAVYGAMALLLVFTALFVANGIVIWGQPVENVLLHVIAAATIFLWLVALERIRLEALLRRRDDRPHPGPAWRAADGDRGAADGRRRRRSRGGLRNAVAETGLEADAR